MVLFYSQYWGHVIFICTVTGGVNFDPLQRVAVVRLVSGCYCNSLLQT